MKNINKFLWILVLGVFLLLSCADLDVAPAGKTFTEDQKSDLIDAVPERLESEIAGMFATLGQTYSPYNRDDYLGFPTVAISLDMNGPDMSTDMTFDWFEVCASYEDRTVSYANPRMRWDIFWTQNKQANDIIKTIGDNPPTELGRHYKGLAHVTRAFDHFSLIPYYQYTYKGNEDKPGIPIIDEDVEYTPEGLGRSTVAAVYEFILADLQIAIDMLEGYVRPSKSYMDQAVAYGLRARVNLVMNNWDAAASDAKKALSLGSYTPYSAMEVSSPGFVDSNDHNWMWAVIFTPDSYAAYWRSWESHFSSFHGDSYGPYSGTYRVINKLLWDQIPSTDVRKGWWVDEDLDSPNIATAYWLGFPGYVGKDMAALNIPGVKYPFDPYTSVKFGSYQNILGNPIAGADWCLMRTEEMILIQAEGEAMGSAGVATAKTTLENFVKNYRDASYSVTAGSATDFQLEVWKQRRIELWGEGFSMFDVMRLKKPMVRFHTSVSSNVSVNNLIEEMQFNMAADDPYILMRFPQRETNANPALENNTGGTQPVSGMNPTLRDGVTD